MNEQITIKFTALAMLVAFVAWADEWTDSTTGRMWSYNVRDDGMVEIEGVSPSTGDLLIPSVLGGRPVTSIVSHAFDDSIELTSVTIPDCITDIGNSAFRNCYGLTSIKLSVGLANVNHATFENCTSLTSVTIPGSAESIDDEAFAGCTSLTNVVIGNGVEYIGEAAFKNCHALRTIEIPDSVVVVFADAFSNCSDQIFDKTSMPGVWLVDRWAIRGDASLAGTLNLTGVRGVAEEAFSSCVGLCGVTFSDGLRGVGPHAFSGCTGMTGMKDLSIPASVMYIGRGAFSECRHLESVELPFLGLSRDGRWTDEEDDSWYALGYIFSGDREVALTLKAVVITDAMQIPRDAFYGCAKLASVRLCEGITSIGSYAFYGCKALTNVTIPASVTCVGGGLFCSDDKLKTVTFLGDAPWVGDEECDHYLFGEAPQGVVVLVPKNSTGWMSGSSDELPVCWPENDGRRIKYSGGTYSGGSTGGGTTTSDTRYSLTSGAEDRAIASVTVDGDSSIDEFVLKDGKVYDCVVRIVNTAARAVKVTLPEGYTYETFKGTKPLTIPASSRNILTITRTADRTFLVSRRELETAQ